MRKITVILLVIIGAIQIAPIATAQSMQKNSAYMNYIAQYAEMARDQMKRHGIPASITLAQGLLESAAGQSLLARKANNHFGIKVTSEWRGKFILRDDDKPNEQFRAYGSVAESFEDHSLFLKRPRYQQLFSLSTTDYQGWAIGLKSCGYATSPTYASNLINIIELYALYQYDRPDGQIPIIPMGSLPAENINGAVVDQTTMHVRGIQDIVRFCNGSRYVILQPGETIELLSKYYGISVRKLRKMNELPKGIVLAPGDIIYLDYKSSKAAKVFKKHYHVVKSGESIYSISQYYGMKMKTLYKLNKLTPDYRPRPGDYIRLR